MTAIRKKLVIVGDGACGNEFRIEMFEHEFILFNYR